MNRISKDFEQLLFPFKGHKAITVVNVTCQTSETSHLFMLYKQIQVVWYTNYSVLTNNLSNICAEISKTGFILWMSSTVNVKWLQEFGKKNRK